MHAPKIKLCAQYTTEIKVQVINKQCKDTMVQFKPVEMYKHRKLLDYNSFLGKVPAIITNFLLCAGDRLKIWIC